MTNEHPMFPGFMTDQRRWLVRRSTGQVKQPHSPLSKKPTGYVPKLADEKPTQWKYRWNQECICATYDEATEFVANKAGYDGLTFTLHPFGDTENRERIICLDFDDAFDETGSLWPEARDIIDPLDGFAYVEYSRSGNGLHAFLRVQCTPFKNKKVRLNAQCVIDVLCSNPVAVTGRVFETYSDMAPVPFEFVGQLPGFEQEVRSQLDECDLSDWWSTSSTPIDDKHAALADEMRNWTPAIEGQGRENITFRAACEILRAGVTGWDAVQLLALVPTSPPYDHERLQHKIEDAYRETRADGSFNLGLPEFEQIAKASESSAEIVERTPINLADTTDGKPWPADFEPHVFDNPIGEYVLANDPHTEADPHNVFMNLMELFGCYLGKEGSFRFNNSINYPNNFLKNIGDTGSRKETAWQDAKAAFYSGEPALFLKTAFLDGISTGEGIINAVKDSESEYHHIPRDGRKLCRAPELSRVMACIRRTDSTLSSVLREAHDGGVLAVTTKTSPMTAANAHICWVSDVTPEEYKLIITPLDVYNGLLNREQFNLVRASKILDNPGRTPDVAFMTVANAIEDAQQWISEGREFCWSPKAQALWSDFYRHSRKSLGSAVLDALAKRAPTHVVRQSMRLAALAKTDEIQPEHLHAAIDIWRRCQQSIAYLMGACAQSDSMTLYDALCEAGDKGMTRTQIRDLFQRHKSRDEITELLRELQRGKLVRGEQVGKRKVEKWYAIAKRTNT